MPPVACEGNGGPQLVDVSPCDQLVVEHAELLRETLIWRTSKYEGEIDDEGTDRDRGYVERDEEIRIDYRVYDDSDGEQDANQDMDDMDEIAYETFGIEWLANGGSRFVDHV